MVSELKGSETVLTGLLEDRSALFGVLAQIEALGLELLELRQIRARPKSPESGDDRSPDWRVRLSPHRQPKVEPPCQLKPFVTLIDGRFSLC